MPKPSLTWEEIVFQALTALGGRASLPALYARARAVREARGLPLSATWRATIRRVLQESKRFTQEEKRSGIWARAVVGASRHADLS